MSRSDPRVNDAEEKKSYIRQQRWIVGISGASGLPYAISLIRHLFAIGIELSIVLSDDALQILMHENKNFPRERNEIRDFFLNASIPNVYDLSRIHNLYREMIPELKSRDDGSSSVGLFFNKEMFAPFASGSYVTKGMVIVPCTVSTLAKLANGIADNLLLRTGEVTLKEARMLITVPRETPLSLASIENMLKLKQAGAHIVPANPGFYHKPTQIEDIVEFIVGKLLNLMKLPNAALDSWKA